MTYPRLEDKCEEVFAEYNVKHNIDILHAIVTEARARKQSGEIGNDVWKEDLQPRAAVRARTVPLLENEAARLRATLEKVWDSVTIVRWSDLAFDVYRWRKKTCDCKLKFNAMYRSARRQMSRRRNCWIFLMRYGLLFVVQVMAHSRIQQVSEKWSKLPLEEIEMWTVQTVESSGPPRPP